MVIKKCIHGKRKTYCLVCGGGSMCTHGRIKSCCKDCGGTIFCIHGKRKSRCKECGGSELCIHERIKSDCRICRGSAYCVHDIRKSYCKECNGSAYCIHDKRKSRCKECGGSELCIHERIKSDCKICKGSSVCIHDKLKKYCKDCGGSVLCKIPYCDSIKLSIDKPYCRRCYSILHPDDPISTRYRLKEIQVVQDIEKYLNDNKYNYEILKNKTLRACSLRRPDLFIECYTHVIIIEIDEDAHENYDETCEKKRTCELWQDIAYRPIVFIRFNPDKYQDESCFGYSRSYQQLIIKPIYESRLEVLCQTIENYIKIVPEKSITNEFLFYDTI